MGWTFREKCTKTEMVASRIRKSDWVTDASDVSWTGWPAGSRIVHETLRHKLVGNNLWKLTRHTVTAADGTTLKDDVFIALDLLEAYGRGWGYKDMCESMGPYETNCPVEYLDLAPQPVSEYATKWRAAVRARAAALQNPQPVYA